VNTPHPKSHQNAVTGLLEANPSSVEFRCSSLDEVNKRANLVDDESVSSSNQGELLLWVNDYKCSLCGFELPLGFVEERQEHTDFHLAERLQKEESCSETRTLMPRHRYCDYYIVVLVIWYLKLIEKQVGFEC
jgi:DNA polymerase kappa